MIELCSLKPVKIFKRHLLHPKLDVTALKSNDFKPRALNFVKLCKKYHFYDSLLYNCGKRHSKVVHSFKIMAPVEAADCEPTRYSRISLTFPRNSLTFPLNSLICPMNSPTLPLNSLIFSVNCPTFLLNSLTFPVKSLTFPGRRRIPDLPVVLDCRKP